MKTKILLTLTAPAALLAFTSCSTTSNNPFVSNPNAIVEKGVPGGVIVETHKLKATVTQVEPATRTVTIVEDNGQKSTVKCGPDVINFDQIHFGDKVRMTVTSELAVSMADAASAPSDGGEAAALLAPKGAKPGGFMAETRLITGTVTGIDTLNRQVTLRFDDGTVRTVDVRPDVDMSKTSLGEKVVIRSTMAVAISVTKR